MFHDFFAMTDVEGSPTHIHKGLLSSDRVVFVIVSATIIGVLVEAGIIRVSGFVGARDLSQEIIVSNEFGIMSLTR